MTGLFCVDSVTILVAGIALFLVGLRSYFDPTRS